MTCKQTCKLGTTFYTWSELWVYRQLYYFHLELTEILRAIYKYEELYQKVKNEKVQYFKNVSYEHKSFLQAPAGRSLVQLGLVSTCT